MAHNDEVEELRKMVLALQEENEQLKMPPYRTGTVLEIGKKTTRVAVDGQGVYELVSSPRLNGKLKQGARIVVHPMSMAIMDYSEFKDLGGTLGVVEEVMNGRVKINSKGESKLIINSIPELKAGEQVVLDSSGNLALEKISSTKTQYHLEEIPHAPWSTIGGLEDVIAKIKEEVELPFIHRDTYARYGRKPAKGILLYGPPGCGKTMVAKSIAYNLSQLIKSDTNGHFINVKGPEILDKWLGNSEANIRKIYSAAREVANGCPVVVFIDEAESVLKTRGSGISTDVYDSIVPQFLSEMDGLNGSDNVITVLATNSEDILDPAVLRDGRVDRRIRITRPNEKGAREIFNIYLREKPFQKGSKPEQIVSALVEKIYRPENVVYQVVAPREGVLGNFTYRNLVSGALIKGIVDRACSYAIMREIAGKDKGLCVQDLENSVEAELGDNTGFAQVFVKEDWEDVFGAQGRQYQEALRHNLLVLEKPKAQPKYAGGKK